MKTALSSLLIFTSLMASADDLLIRKNADLRQSQKAELVHEGTSRKSGVQIKISELRMSEQDNSNYMILSLKDLASDAGFIDFNLGIGVAQISSVSVFTAGVIRIDYFYKDQQGMQRAQVEARLQRDVNNLLKDQIILTKLK